MAATIHEKPYAQAAVSRQQWKTLHKWFEHNARDLPWRHRRSAYRVWISEVMLQQTQVETVRPYYQRFMKELPGIRALAEADEDFLLSLWSGLGYYSRARNLKKAAQLIMSEHSGRFPRDPVMIRKLPGFGPYTTAAVLSLSAGVDLAVLDGNVMRVFCRFFALTENIRQNRVQRQLQLLADRSLWKGRAALCNESLMELGALICRPRNPDCGRCPWNKDCEARKQKLETALPIKSPARKGSRYALAVLVLMDSAGRILVRKRKKGGMLAGLWELPNLRAQSAGKPAGSQRQEVLLQLLRSLGYGMSARELGAARDLGTFTHSYSHFGLYISAWQVLLSSHRTGSAAESSELEGCWIMPADILALGISASDRKIIELLPDKGRSSKGC